MNLDAIKDYFKNLTKWKIIQIISTTLFGGISVLWLFGITMHFLDSATTLDFTIFKDYGQIALTVFGFTLIGGIFEKNKPHSKIEKKLFDISILFLSASIAHFFMYSLSFTLTKNLNSIGGFQQIMIVWSFFFAMLIGFYGIIAGFLYLFKILIDYRISLD